MYRNRDGMKGKIAELMDSETSAIGEISLAVAVNNFLSLPVSFEEALAIYARLLNMSHEGDGSNGVHLCSRLQSEIRDLSPAMITEKMRDYSVSIRKILVDSVTSSLCRQHDVLLGHVRRAVCSNSADELLALSDKAALVVPDVNATSVPVRYFHSV